MVQRATLKVELVSQEVFLCRVKQLNAVRWLKASTLGSLEEPNPVLDVDSPLFDRLLIAIP